MVQEEEIGPLARNCRRTLLTQLTDLFSKAKALPIRETAFLNRGIEEF